MKRITGLLREYGSWHVKYIDYSGYSGLNILYRLPREGVIQRSPSRDRILCPDMPRHLALVEHAINRLPKWEKTCVRAWFCAPCKPDGTIYTHRDVAILLKLGKYQYKTHLRNGVKRIEKNMRV